MSKGLDALKKIKLNRQFSLEMFEKELATIEKELKALEIIKNKLSPLARYTFYPLTHEEYDLIEEVLQ